jgi:hypothetical protein
MLFLVAFFWLFAAAICLLPIIAMWLIYQKAGKPGWTSIIPIYSYYVLLKIVGKPGWWMWLWLVPVVNIVYAIWALNMLSKSFGKDEGFTIGLLLLGIVFYPILAFGNATYLGPYGNPEAFKAAQDPHFDFDSGDKNRS